MIEEDALRGHLEHVTEYVNEMSPTPNTVSSEKSESNPPVFNLPQGERVSPHAKELLLNDTIVLPYQA